MSDAIEMIVLIMFVWTYWDNGTSFGISLCQLDGDCSRPQESKLDMAKMAPRSRSAHGSLTPDGKRPSNPALFVESMDVRWSVIRRAFEGLCARWNVTTRGFQGLGACWIVKARGFEGLDARGIMKTRCVGLGARWIMNTRGFLDPDAMCNVNFGDFLTNFTRVVFLHNL